MSNKSKVMVLGGAGFIGSHLVELLVSRDYQVNVIDNLSTGKIANIDMSSILPLFPVYL